MKSDSNQEAELGMDQLVSVAMLIIMVSVAVAVGANLSSDLQDDFGANSCAARTDSFTSYNVTADQCYNSTGSHTAVDNTAFNVTSDGLEASGEVTSKLTIVATTVVGIVLLALVARIVTLKFG